NETASPRQRNTHWSEPTQEQIARLTLRAPPPARGGFMSALLPVTVWTIACSCLTGLLLALLGSLKLAIARHPEHVTDPLPLLMSLLEVALLLLLLVAGVLLDLWGLQPMMIVGPVLLSLSLLALSFRPNLRSSMVAVLFAAMAAAIVAVTATVLMPRAL